MFPRRRRSTKPEADDSNPHSLAKSSMPYARVLGEETFAMPVAGVGYKQRKFIQIVHTLCTLDVHYPW